MKIIKALPLGIAPAILVGYGWHLGQLHQSGNDIAGILLFISGVIGLILGVIFFLLTRKYSWHEKWWVQTFAGLAACGIAFALILVLAEFHG